MTDLFLKREKELLKLNESINMKCANTLDPKSAKKEAIEKIGKQIKPVKSIKNGKFVSKPLITNKTQNLVEFAEEKANPIQRRVADELNETFSSENATKNEIIESNIALKLDNNNRSYESVHSPIERFLNDFTVSSIALNAVPNEKQEKNNIHEENGQISGAISLIPNNLVRRNVSTDGIIKFLKAKVTILQQELDLSHKENTKNLDNLSKCMEQQKKFEMARDQAINKVNNLKNQIQKMEQLNSNADGKLKEHEMCQQSLRKENDELKSKVKTMHETNSKLELRLFKSQEDLECVRKNFHATKATEKDLQSTLQQERKFYENQLKISQKQRNDLIAAYKKQLLLLDNLKRQNACLEQAKMVQMAENEFMKILEWHNDNGK